MSLQCNWCYLQWIRRCGIRGKENSEHTKCYEMLYRCIWMPSSSTFNGDFISLPLCVSPFFPMVFECLCIHFYSISIYFEMLQFEDTCCIEGIKTPHGYDSEIVRRRRQFFFATRHFSIFSTKFSIDLALIRNHFHCQLPTKNMMHTNFKWFIAVQW